MADRICSIPDCTGKLIARGWCNMHYLRWRTHGDPMLGAAPTRQTCKFEGCTGPAVGWGWCELHYRRWLRHGDPEAVLRIVGDDLARFESYLAPGPIPSYAPHLGPCWLWTAGLDPDGYPTFNTADEQTAHRWSYAFHISPIPDGLELDHLCVVRRCVNAWHLEPVTHAENVRRSNYSRAGRQWPSLATLSASSMASAAS